ncbi:MAG: hypothetical protein J6J18_07875 [Oscillospiraceae bacterium]|nr:hypothetical protein [Oscillospiraceae bacterium]
MMTERQKKMKKYTDSVERRLNLPRDVKARVMTDFVTSIAARQEAGQTDEQIYAELGEPKKVSADLNEQMKEYVYRKSPWRFLLLALAIAAGLWLAFYAGMQLMVRSLAGQAGDLGIIGGADGPTAIFVTTSSFPDWDIVIMAAALIVGIAGYIRLRRCKPKK